jgi:hypothetical protein
MDIKAGRSPFEIRSDDKDYSGLSIHDRFLADTNIQSGLVDASVSIKLVQKSARSLQLYVNLEVGR